MYKFLKRIFCSAGALSTSSAWASPWNMPRGVTPISQDIYDLHMTIFWICVLIGAGVFSVMFYSIIKHRKSKGVKPAGFHSNLKIEIIWAVIPFLILVGMAIPATKVLMRMEDASYSEINIKVTGYQWKWEYEYLDEGIKFFSNLSTPVDEIKGKTKKNKWYLLEVDKPLVVPIHKKIRFLVTSNDVIHSWWVPALGIKRDAIPGFMYEAWTKIDKPGVYRGQCAELCGINHAFMPIVVIAKTEEDYAKWVAKQRGEVIKASEIAKATATKTFSLQELMTQGKKDYTAHCAVCHKPDGTGMPPAFPALKGGKITVGAKKPHIDIVLNGKAGSAMQAFKHQLNDAQIAGIVTYERNAWGNDDKQKYGSAAGGIVQPADVSKLRK